MSNFYENYRFLVWKSNLMSGHYNGFTHIVTIEILAKDLVSEPTFLKTNVFKIIQAEELSSGLWNNNNKHWVVPNSVYFTRRFNHNGANRQGISKKDTVLTKVVMFEASEYSSIIPLLDVQTYICCLQCIEELQKFLEDNHYNATAKQFVSGYHWCSFGTKTRKMDCSAFIRVALTSDYKRLMIIELCLQHENHDGSEDFYELLPKNRQLLSKDKNNVEELIKMKSSASAIRMKVLKETGVQMTAKDFQNLKQKIKPPNDNDTLKSVVALLRQTYHASVDVHTILTKKKDGNEKVFSSLLFQTESMKKTFQAWPEMIFVDGTYGFFKNQLITIVICIMDSNNISHIVAIGWVVNEEANTLLELMKSFKNRNIEGCSKVKTIMTDKDLTERAVLKELFVNADLYICEFHVLKIFSRTITKGAMNITSEERNTALNFLDRLTKCDTKEKYYELYTEFCNSVPESVLNYYNDNWHEIKEQWVRF